MGPVPSFKNGHGYRSFHVRLSCSSVEEHLFWKSEGITRIFFFIPSMPVSLSEKIYIYRSLFELKLLDNFNHSVNWRIFPVVIKYVSLFCHVWHCSFSTYVMCCGIVIVFIDPLKNISNKGTKKKGRNVNHEPLKPLY